jgi:hypothetical protein
MNRLLLLCFLTVAVLFSYGFQQTAQAQTQELNGRYKIFYSPIARTDTFLLDTQTGKVWQLVKDKDDNLLWQPMERKE